MSDFKIIRTNHTGITVSDVETTRAFFSDVLGFPTTETVHHKGEMVENLTGVPGAEVKISFVDMPNHRLELVEYLTQDERKVSDLRNCDPGAFHLALEVDDVDAAVEAVKPSGFVPYSVPQIVPNGNCNVYLRHPDGITIEFQITATQ
jgi:glyoxylase I family protein